jgi:hypothetical protein
MPTSVRVGIVGLILLAVAFAFAQKHAVAQSVAPAGQVIQNLVLVGTSTIQASAPGDGALQLPEIAVDALEDSSPKGATPAQPAAASGIRNAHNLAIPGKEEARQRLSSSQLASGSVSAESQKLPLPEPVAESDLVASPHGDDFEGFNGLSHIDQRTANQGNQFSIEPPDQGLCAGNGYVVETVNTVIRVYDDEGNRLSGVQDLNSFFGLAPQIIRGKPNRIGPTIGDPRCYFDPQKMWPLVPVRRAS